MIKVKKDGNIITFAGHTEPRLCSCVSCIMYTTLYAIRRYDESSFNYFDENDIVTIEILHEDDIITMLIDNMFDMLKELINEEEHNKSCIKIID